MPIYEYQCANCGTEFEEWQKFSDPAVDTCPECGGEASRLISRSTFILKGSGWYVTDYGTKNQSTAPKAPEAKESAPKSKDSGTTTEKSTAATKDTSSGKGSSGAKSAKDS